MYHSHLLINTGDNPDRPDWRITRRWLRNLYRVHQRLCMAFPTTVPASRTERIAAYCAPFGVVSLNELRDLPGEPDMSEVHFTRSDEASLLFRIDYPVDYRRGCRRPVLIVQSAEDRAPDWDYAFGLTPGAVNDCGRPIGNAGFLLDAKPQTRLVSIEVENGTLKLTDPKEQHNLAPGDEVRFRLRANPTRKVQDGSPNGKRKRVEPTIEAHREWLQRKLGVAAEGLAQITNFVPGWAYGWRSKYEPQPSQRMQWWSVLFEGTFRVGDPVALKSLLIDGIGPAKAFGFGLLSVAPIRG